MVAMMDPFLVDGPSLLTGSFTPLQSSLISSSASCFRLGCRGLRVLIL
ncbi:hypothetical protein BIFDEN_02289 [Bifidobacterium dentium ATCC 27678]|nr:hypothetical protein BIFDEN_02289 [Bifidobacterium dentium ATCC 27678]